MRIGLLIYGSLDTVSGGYLYDRMLAKHLCAAGHEVQVISLPWRNYLQHLGDNLSIRFYDRLRRLPLDLLLEDELNHPSLAWANGWLRSRADYPICSIVHHLRSSEEHPHLWHTLYRWVERKYLNSVDGFIYNSRTTQSTVGKLLKHEAPGIVAYPAADHVKPPNTTAILAHREVLCQESGPLRILFVGNVIARKGLHILLAALAGLPPSCWRLEVVGSLSVDRAYVKRVRRQIWQDGIQDHVRLTGSASDSELRHCWQRSHLLAVPSFEGFGIVYLEAMGFGLPVIASTAGAAREIVGHGREGYLVDPVDVDGLRQRISALQQDRTTLLTMSVAARHRYDRHPSWRQGAQQIMAWLEERASPIICANLKPTPSLDT